MYANEFAKKDGLLRVHLIGHGEEPPKSDAFLLEYQGMFVLIDGGLFDCDASLNHLLNIRRALLTDHEELWEDTDCRLRLTVMISHCHRDHIGALITEIFPSPYIEVETVYMPPDSVLDKKYGKSGDIKYRSDFARALTEYQPGAGVIDVAFGAENRLTIPMSAENDSAPVITVCPPWINSADPERVALLINALKPGEENPDISTLVVNNNSVWIHIRFSARTFLFTGDTVKKTKPMGYEMPEEMIEVYADTIGGQVDVLKYLHHGYKRDGAADVMMSLSPRYIVLSTHLATGEEAIRQKYPENDVKFVNCGPRTHIFACDGEQLTLTTENESKKGT